MTNETALEKALALCKHLGIRGDDWDLRQIAAELMRAYVEGIKQGFYATDIYRILAEADKLEGK